MKELFTVVTRAKAAATLEENWSPKPPRAEKVELSRALGRVTAREISAREDIPGFTRSTVDGFALKAADTFGASEGMPAYVTLVGEVAMGQEPGGEIKTGQCLGIATGGMLPPGSDAVVMVEHTEALDSTTIGILRPAAPGENVIRRGEDLLAGGVLVPAGRRLKASDLGILAAGGVTVVPVACRPKVALISTGDELVDPREEPSPGQIRDINTYTLGALVEEAGAQVVDRWVLPDRYHLLYSHLGQALSRADLVIISGGTSVGSRDLTEEVINAAGSPGVLVHGLALKPGKPTIIGLVQEKTVFGLSGNPVSAMVTFDLLIRPVLAKLQGIKGAEPFIIKARISQNVASTAGREDYVRVVLSQDEKGLVAEPILGKSGLISTMVQADGLARIPLAREGVLAGEEVQVILL